MMSCHEMQIEFMFCGERDVRLGTKRRTESRTISARNHSNGPATFTVIHCHRTLDRYGVSMWLSFRESGNS
jgi:hypothetical protein